LTKDVLYKDVVKEACTQYAKDTATRFIGYNTVKGSRMYGSLSNVSTEQCIEMPVTENLMVGMGVGMALDGMKPVVCFERHDFLLLGLDALVNHIDKLPHISGNQYKLPIVIRAIVGAAHPLNPGPQHTMDYSKELATMLKFTPVYIPRSFIEFKMAYDEVGKSPSGAVVIIEYRDWYDKTTEWLLSERGSKWEMPLNLKLELYKETLMQK